MKPSTLSRERGAETAVPVARGGRMFALKALATAALLALTFRAIRPAALAARLAGADGGELAVAALLLAAGGFAGAASWLFILRARLPAIPFRAVAACHWSGMFFNSFLPSNVGGDVVKGYLLARERGQAGFVAASVLLDRAIHLALLLGIGVFALLFQAGRHGWCAALLCAAAASVPVAIVSARRLQRRRPRETPPGIRGTFASLLDAFLDWAAAPRLFLPALAAALAAQTVKTWSSVFVIRALGLALPAGCVWTAIPLFGTVSALPVTVGGLGLRELVAQRVAGPMRLDPTELVALSLGGHLAVVAVNLLGLAPFLLARRRRKRAGE